MMEAVARDAIDPLAPLRTRFAHPDPALIYLDGNSLGRMPVTTAALMQDVVAYQWGDRLIRAWNEGWFTLPERLGGKIAQLIGAQADEVIVADSTSVNLYKLATAALRARSGRTRILTDDGNFPSDLYILQGIAQEHGATLEVIASADGIHGSAGALMGALGGDVALLTLSHTLYKSAYTYDMAALTTAAHNAGALTLWDLSHAAGAVPVALNAAGADLAVGCCYKYLNGGPGAPAFLYVRRDLQTQLFNPIQGWMGQRNLFAFEGDYAPVDGLRRFLSDRSRNRYEAGSGTLRVSKIFDWYRKDFEQGHKGYATLESVFARHAERLADHGEANARIRAGQYKLDFLPYDWALNDAPQ